MNHEIFCKKNSIGNIQLISDKENIYLVIISHRNRYTFFANFNINAKTILQTIKWSVQVFKKQYI